MPTFNPNRGYWVASVKDGVTAEIKVTKSNKAFVVIQVEDVGIKRDGQEYPKNYGVRVYQGTPISTPNNPNASIDLIEQKLKPGYKLELDIPFDNFGWDKDTNQYTISRPITARAVRIVDTSGKPEDSIKWREEQRGGGQKSNYSQNNNYSQNRGYNNNYQKQAYQYKAPNTVSRPVMDDEDIPL